MNTDILKSLKKCSTGILSEYLLNAEKIKEEENINDQDNNEQDIEEEDIEEQDIEEENNINLVPIVKWSGGKKDEISRFIDHIPKYNLYIEPFIGGGSVYFHLNPRKAVIADVHDKINMFL